MLQMHWPPCCLFDRSDPCPAADFRADARSNSEDEHHSTQSAALSHQSAQATVLLVAHCNWTPSCFPPHRMLINKKAICVKCHATVIDSAANYACAPRAKGKACGASQAFKM